MAFVNDLKSEVAAGKREYENRGCHLAELSAILIHCGMFELGEETAVLKIATDQAWAAKRYLELIDLLYKIDRDDMEIEKPGEGRRRFHIRLTVKEDIRTILHELRLEKSMKKSYHNDSVACTELLDDSCCIKAFIAGTFLACGTMRPPEKQYHLEMVCDGKQQAGQLCEMMRFFGLEPKMTVRRDYHVVYLKDGGQVSDMLRIMEANNSLLSYENVRIEREIRGQINRQVNCEAANISKTIAAALDQVRDIELIRNTIGLETLTKELYETALLRLDNPDTSLKDLGLLLVPPVGKSGMKHRFQKLKQTANDIRAKLEE